MDLEQTGIIQTPETTISGKYRHGLQLAIFIALALAFLVPWRCFHLTQELTAEMRARAALEKDLLSISRALEAALKVPLWDFSESNTIEIARAFIDGERVASLRVTESVSGKTVFDFRAQNFTLEKNPST